MTARQRAGRAVAVAAWALLGSGLCVLAPVPAAHAEDMACDPGATPDSERLADTTVKSNPAFDRMRVKEAHSYATGAGVTIAVVDSGVAAVPGAYRLAGGWGGGPPLQDGHGTIVAGLAAGAEGMAPGAGVYDVRVYDQNPPDEGERGLTSTGMAAGLNHVADVARQFNIRVVNVSLSVASDDPVLRAAVERLVAADVVVVAASGNVSAEGAEDSDGTAGSDADVFPADYKGVLGVSAVAPRNLDPWTTVKPNRDTDVAAPTQGAHSYNATGQKCRVQDAATSWAAAEVSGLAALLRERYPQENAKQIMARITATTEGAGAPVEGTTSANSWTGAGVVQAYDALSRVLSPSRSGSISRSVRDNPDARTPDPPARIDLFGSARTTLLWGGLVAGSLLALAYILRPLVRRRS